MELYAFTETGEFLGVIDVYSSLRWRRRFWAAGEIELHVLASPENIAMLQDGVILRRLDRRESARIYGVYINDGEMTITGRMLTQYFHFAYVIGAKTFTGTPAEILCQLAEDARDTVPELVIDRSDLPPGDVITIQLDFANTLKAMQAVAKAYGLGFIMLYGTGGKFTFKVYTGTNHSAEQHENPIVQFTDEFGNFVDAEYTRDESEYCNVAYARGSDGTVACVDRSKGERKRVCYVDSSSITPDDKTRAQYLEELQTECGWALFDHMIAENFSGTATDIDNFVYTEDWDLGDIVTTGDSTIGITMTERVTEVEELYENGQTTIYPITGNAKSETLNLEGI